MTKYLYLLMIIVFMSFNSSAVILADLHKIGHAKMSVLFFDVYDIELLSKDKNWQPDSYPQALKITYLRDISKEDLLKATKEQWQHIQLKQPNENLWLKKLDAIWPDIKEGNGLTILVDPYKTSKFYFTSKEHKNLLIGEISDPGFGPAFLDIWLGENTSEPKLRKRLIGK